MLSPATVPEIRRICDAHEIRLDFIPELIGLQRLQPPMEPSTTVEAKDPTIAMPEPALSSYFVLKKFLELFAAVTVLVLFLPFWLLLGTMALCDVGSPISFWQQGLGQGGRPFLLHKIRTLKPPFDWRGRKVLEAARLSAIGRLMRKCRFDELAQLLNVLVGDMSLRLVHGRCCRAISPPIPLCDCRFPQELPAGPRSTVGNC
jgi:lipopolysaccharide/colanic/teichoic acid biosynthesis glycosyltransferase